LAITISIINYVQRFLKKIGAVQVLRILNSNSITNNFRLVKLIII